MSVTIRPAQPADAAECGRICHDAFAAIAGAHGFPTDFPSVQVAQGLIGWLIGAEGAYGVVAERDGRVIGQGGAMVVEHQGVISGYATAVAFFGHAVGRSNEDLMALIGAAPEFAGPGFLVPTRNHELFAWCLASGLRLVQQLNLMSIGLYSDPAGAWLPSILF